MSRTWILPLLFILWSRPDNAVSQDDVYVNVSVTVNNVTDIVTVKESLVRVLTELLYEIYEVTSADQPIEINECSTPALHNCPENSICVELSHDSGFFRCPCKEGYIASGDTCIVDPCYVSVVEKCNDTQICDINTTSCVCRNGYVANGDGTCRLETICYDDRCPVHSVCTQIDNTTYTCTCNGNGGYEKTGGGYNETIICSDVDECKKNTTTCSPNAACTNTEGSYTCACKGGYNGDGVTCEDIDECAEGLDLCHVNAKCLNSLGTHNCVCNAGYGGDGIVCTDINECETNTTCPTNDCANTVGGYFCYVIKDATITVSAQEGSTAMDFEIGLEYYLSNVLSIDVDVTASGMTPSFMIVVDAPMSYKQAIEYLFYNLAGKSIGGFRVNSASFLTMIEYSGTLRVDSGVTSETECEKIKNHVETNGDVTGGSVTCLGTVTDDDLSFTVTAEGQSTIDLASVLATYVKEITSTADGSCVCSNENATCSSIAGRAICMCKESYHDADFQNPGTKCVNPIHNVTCKDSEIGTVLYAAYFHKFQLEIGDLHLLERTCTGQQTGDWFVFSTSVDQCQTTVNFTGNQILYENEVTNIIPGGIHIHPTSVKLGFKCCYPSNFSSGNSDDGSSPGGGGGGGNSGGNLIDVGSGFGPIESTVIVQNIKGTGTLTLSMSVYKDSSFTTHLTTDDSVRVADPIYIQVNHSASVIPNYLKIRTCHATPSNDPDDATSLPLITNSCPDPSNEQISELQSGLFEYASFKLLVIRFEGSNSFFLHCDVTLCEEECSEDCTSRGRRRRRRDAEDSTLTVGPISTEGADSSSGGESAAAAAGTGGAVAGSIIGVIAAMCVVAFIVWKRKQNSDYSQSNPSTGGYFNPGFSNQTSEYSDCPSRISRRY